MFSRRTFDYKFHSRENILIDYVRPIENDQVRRFETFEKDTEKRETVHHNVKVNWNQYCNFSHTNTCGTTGLRRLGTKQKGCIGGMETHTSIIMYTSVVPFGMSNFARSVLLMSLVIVFVVCVCLSGINENERI